MIPSHILRSLRHNPLILPFYIPSLIFAICQGLLIPILPLFALDFNVSYGLVGWVLAGEGIGMLVGDVPAGILLRYLGKKQTMILGVACAALANGTLFWTDTIPLVIACRFGSGFGIALFNISRHAFIAETITITNRGKAIALFGGVTRIGRFIGPAIGGFVAAGYGLRAPFLLFGGAALIALALIGLFVVRTYAVSLAESRVAKTHLYHLGHTLQANAPILIRAGSGQLFAQMIRAGRTVIIPLYAAEILDLTVDDIGLIVSIAAAVDMTLFYPAGYVMDRWGRKFSILPSFTIQVIGMALIPLTSDFTSLMLTTSLIGFGNGLGSGTMMTLGADLAPKESPGEFLGVWRLIGDLGHSSAPILVGNVATILGLSMGAVTIAGAGLMGVAVFLLLVPETLSRQPLAKVS